MRLILLTLAALLATFSNFGKNADSSLQISYINAIDFIQLQKKCPKKYTWLVIWVPSCGNANKIFNTYTQLGKQYSNNIELVLVAVVKNIDTFRAFSNRFSYSKKFYVVDTNYGLPMDRHINMMRDIDVQLKSNNRLFNHLIMDKNGNIVLKKEITKNEERKLHQFFKKLS